MGPGHACGVRVHKVQRVQKVQRERFLGLTGLTAGGFLSLTALRAEGCGIALGHTFGVKVLKMDRPDGRKVLKFDGLSGRGLRIARRAMLIKSALRISFMSHRA